MWIENLRRLRTSRWVPFLVGTVVLSCAVGVILLNVASQRAVAQETPPVPDDVPQVLPRDLDGAQIRFVHPTEAEEEAARNCPTGHIRNAPGSDVWHCMGRDGKPLSPGQIEELNEKREREIQQNLAKNYALSFGKTIQLRNGRTITVPDDVRVQQTMFKGQCMPGRPCPEPPFHRLTRRGTLVWIDGYGEIFRSRGDMSDPGLFSFLKPDTDD